MCLNDQWQTIQKQRLQVTHLDCCLCCSLCSAVWLDCVILILDMHIGHSRRSEWDAEIQLSGHGYKSHTDINRPPPPLPVHTVACISSALTCNCKVGKHMRHKQLSSQSADRWPTGPKFVYTILYEYCMYGLTNIFVFLWFMSIYDTEQRSQSWTALNLIESENSADTAKGSCQIEQFLPNLLVYQMKEEKQKSFSCYIFFKIQSHLHFKLLSLSEQWHFNSDLFSSSCKMSAFVCVMYLEYHCTRKFRLHIVRLPPPRQLCI